jgi:ubiquinone/menaquinone biosynthesis C-methylase UbiE
MDMERAVGRRYSAAAHVVEPGLCCPVDYDPQYLEVIPREVLEVDYGCGNPVSHVRPGERVLDLGSGAGKVCFIAAQIIGPTGSVLGVDINDDMLAVARNARAEVARRLGYSNVTFVKARIEDLALDLDFLDSRLARHPVRSYNELANVEALSDQLRNDSPLVPDNSIDVVISNCVLNLVTQRRKQAMFSEIARVLRPGGRVVVSDIVSDIDVPAAMQADPDLWSGCYSGALREELFLQSFSRVGLDGLTVLTRQMQPWQTVGEVEFRSITVVAYKPGEKPVGGETSAAIYRGPFAAAATDSGLQLPRGRVVPLCAEDLRSLRAEPYRDHILFIEADDRSCGGRAQVDVQQPAAVNTRHRPPAEALNRAGPPDSCSCSC